MKYALGNMLNGAGGLDPDGLALDLQFAADKTLTARKGPSPILTRGSTGTFVGSNGLIQTAASGAARFDHDPANPTICRGLLIEEGRTNLLVRSGELRNTTSWFTVASTQNSSSEVAPDGGTTAVSLVEDSTNQGHFIYQNISLGSAAYTYSIFAKAGSRNWIYVDIFNGTLSPVSNGAYFNLSNGTIGNIDSGVTASITAHSNGWYRCSVTSTRAVASAVIRMASANGTNAYLGNGTGNVLLWGAQFEAGSFATSYIPTTTSALARSADVCSIAAPDFATFYNQPEGTFFVDVTPQTVDQDAFIFGVNTTTFSNSHGINKSNATISGAGKRWGVATYTTSTQVAITTSTDVAVSRSRLAYGYKLNDFAFAYAGGIVGTDTSGTIPTSTTMRIGSRDGGGTFINGHLAAVRYYKKRLPNAKLASLTV